MFAFVNNLFDSGKPVAYSSSGAVEQAKYAVVEIFGHRRHVGRILEVERFGIKMLRVDEMSDRSASAVAHPKRMPPPSLQQRLVSADRFVKGGC